MTTKILVFIAANLSLTATAQITDMKVNNLTAPMGVDDTHPRMEWTATCPQTAYDITVGTDSSAVAQGKGSIWDTGLINGATRSVTYAGEKLQPSTIYFWKVTITDGDGQRISSPTTRFETGLMGDWRGAWISDGNGPDHHPAPYFRKQFVINKPIRSARAYISAGGLFELSFNGSRIGDHFLDPVYTRYDRRCSYLTFDITQALLQGDNAVGVVLGNGWYNHQAKAVWDFDRAPWRARPAFCMDIRIEYADGTVEYIPTDLTWRTSDGPLVYNNIYTGEHYDFRLVKDGWNRPGYNDNKWNGVRLRSAPAPKITSQQMSPIRLVEEIKPISVRKIDGQTYVFDFGRNIAGITELHIKGLSGTKLSLAHGERLHPDGRLDQSNIDVYYRGDKTAEPFQTDIVTLDGHDDRFRPSFSYKGFRYVEVQADRPIALSDDNLTAWFVHSDVDEIGKISSSDKILNGVFNAARASYLSNLTGYPTDCPQREKNGWTGDGHLAIETALYSYDAATVYSKWMADHRDEQQPNGVLPDIIPTGGWGYGTDNGLDWTSTIAIIPWNIYLFYGDSRVLRDCYDNIRRYVDYVDLNSPNHLSAWGRGDWVPVKTHSSKELMSSIYYYVDATILAKAAQLFGNTADHERYSRLASDIRRAINEKFLDRNRAVYASGSQTELSMALMWNIVPDDMKARVAEALYNKVKETGFHLDTGVHGAKAVLNALSENGYADAAYRIAVQDTYPSWGWWIRNGATTLLENWDLKATRDISDNHIMFGEIGAWPYKGLGGIFPDEQHPGFEHFFLRPNFVDGLDRFTAYHRSPYGLIVSSWTRRGGKVVYKVTVPPNTTATLTPPANVTETADAELKAGEHKIVFDLKK